MMEGQPLKFRILEILDEHEAGMWTDEIVPIVQKEYNMGNAYGRDMINFDLIEMVSAGLLREGESKLDEDGHYKKDRLITHYEISGLGKTYLDDLRVKVGGKGA